MGLLGPGVPSLFLEKATLKVVVGSGLRETELEFQYNPTQFTVERSTEWSDPPVKNPDGSTPPTFRKINPRSVSMEIFFDAFSTLGGDVTKDVETLLSWTKPCPRRINGLYQPPTLQLEWGSSKVLSGFVGYLSHASATYTMFRMSGEPIRATCSVTLNEVPKGAQGTNPTSGGTPGFQIHMLIEGETLHSVAWAEYGNPRFWRGLAEFNGIDDPTRVPVGTRLLLPPPREAARLS